MKNQKLLLSVLIIVSVLLYALFSFGAGEGKGLSEATFYVH